jgi:hypothetical protein
MADQMTESDAIRLALGWLSRMPASLLTSAEHPKYIEVLRLFGAMLRQPPVPGSPNFTETYRSSPFPAVNPSQSGADPGAAGHRAAGGDGGDNRTPNFPDVKLL